MYSRVVAQISDTADSNTTKNIIVECTVSEKCNQDIVRETE